MSLVSGRQPGRSLVPKSPIRGLRWYIGGLFFLSTVINYIDRQTLSVLAPYLKTQFTWTNADFALVVISFRVAYAVGQTGSGQLLDRVGTRKGLSARCRLLLVRGDADVARVRPPVVLLLPLPARRG